MLLVERARVEELAAETMRETDTVEALTVTVL